MNGNAATTFLGSISLRARFLTAVLASAALVASCASPDGSESAPDATGSAFDATGSAADTVTGVRTAVVENPNPVPIVDAAVSSLPVTVPSFDGAQITVTDTSRIVAADQYGTLAETVFALGLGDRLVGRDRAASFPDAAAIADITPNGHQISAEGILALNPTVFLTDTSTGPRAVQDQLRAAGIPVVFFDPARTLAGVPVQIEAVAAALGVPDEGTALATRSAAEIAAAADLAPTEGEPLKIAFLYMRGPAIKMLAGPGSGADSLIEALGARDAGTESGLTEQFVPITSEALIAAAPDVFLMMTNGLDSIGGVDGLEAIPGIAQTPAGKNRRIVDMEDSVVLSFGPNTGQVLRALSTALYAQ